MIRSSIDTRVGRANDGQVTWGSRERTSARADDALAPGQLSAQSWRELVRRAGGHALEARLPFLSAGVAFFAVLSVAPVLVTALSVYGALNTPAQARSQLSGAAEVLPPQVELLVTDQLTSITTASTGVLTVRGLVGLGLALWTATTAMVALIDALNVAYHETESRGFVRRTLLGLLFVLGGALLIGAAIALAGMISRATDHSTGDVVAVAVWPALALLMGAMLAVVYRFAPDRKNPQWRWTTWGATGATLLWVATSAALFTYVQNLGTYGTTYGSLAGVAISMLWLWITVLIVVLGAAVNGESERQTFRDSTTGCERPMGQRGAVVADTTPSRTNRP